jgi:anti-sigma regulatory factor (Ser/Thr protein kinase)
MTPHAEWPTSAGNTVAGAAEPCSARQVALPSAPQAAGLARREVRDALASWGLERLEDTAVLLTSELVGNAVRHCRHGGSELGLRIADTGVWLRIEVTDVDPRPPRPQPPAELGESESGFGLVLVEALAAKWGVDQAMTGKTVWIELDIRPSGHPGGPPARNQAAAGGDGARRRRPKLPGEVAGEVTAAASDDAQQAAGNRVIAAKEAASLCRGAAALIRGLGWDALAETWDTAGPLPMDVAIFCAAEVLGYGDPDDILDAMLTHIAGLLYAAGEVTRQMLVHDMTEVTMAWEALPGRTLDEILAALNLTASILDRQGMGLHVSLQGLEHAAPTQTALRSSG